MLSAFLPYSKCHSSLSPLIRYNACMSRAPESQLILPLLPDYQVRVSKRARRPQLKVSQEGRVEVVLPRSADPAVASELVAENQVWLEKTLREIGRGQSSTDDRLPTRIRLRAINETWQILYRHGLDRPFRESIEGTGAPVLAVRAAEPARTREMLQRWLSKRARDVLVPWLRQLSEECGLPFGKAAVRAQKSCWGSCSSVGTISINRALLFLPAPVVRYLFIHELCHTVHANHSARFWKLVAKHEPRCRIFDRQLRDQGNGVPRWALPD